MMQKIQYAIEQIDRRKFLRTAARVTMAGFGLGLTRCAPVPDPESETVLLVPRGFTPRIVARSGYQSSLNSSYVWHDSPDGGGCFESPDGGWVYVSNSEEESGGGVGALRFDSNGTIQDSYSILNDTRKNCSGGETPWGTWLSCEEVPSGKVWECAPFADSAARVLPGLGSFSHESACVDPDTHQVYLTEDRDGGCLYRFSPENAVIGGETDLKRGTLEVASVDMGLVSWYPIPDPDASSRPVRDQVSAATKFNGGEGIDFRDGFIRFATKGDNRIWELNVATGEIRIMLKLKSFIRDVDDVTHTPAGGLLVAEDGSGMEVKYIAKSTSTVKTLIKLPEHSFSEITGLAFDPGGTRLYFSSQRGNTDSGSNGITFELSGDFHNPILDTPLVEWKLDHRDISI
jgi:secreted PhoX family phosphatase